MECWLMTMHVSCDVEPTAGVAYSPGQETGMGATGRLLLPPVVVSLQQEQEQQAVHTVSLKWCHSIRLMCHSELQLSCQCRCCSDSASVLDLASQLGSTTSTSRMQPLDARHCYDKCDYKHNVNHWPTTEFTMLPTACEW